MSVLTITRLSTAALLACSFWATPSFSAADSTPALPSCDKGKVRDKKTKKCVKKEKSSSLSQENIYEVARSLSYEKRYDEALYVLQLAGDKSDPRILNYLGYTTRKLGDIEGGMKYYRVAIAIDPNYALVREYMGEAFLQLGQVDEARNQLAEIGKRCGTDCREYAMLKREIDRVVN